MTIRARVAAAAALLLLAALVSGVSAQKDKKDKDKKDKDVKKEVKPAPIGLRAQCDRPTALYKVGETVSFLLASTASGDIEYKITDDGFKVVKEDTIRVAALKTYKLEEKLDHP